MLFYGILNTVAMKQ